MADITVKHVLDLVAETLQDEDVLRRWDESDLVNWYNHAQREIVSNRPDANPVIDAVKLSAGTSQNIPSGGVSLIDVLRNMGTDGNTPGDAVIKTTVDIIRAFDLSWNTATASAIINNWMTISPTQYYVYPPSDGTGWIELVFSQVPDALVYDGAGAWESAFISIKENFVNPLMYMILHYAYLRDTDVPEAESRANFYKNLALQGLGMPSAPTQQPAA